MRRASIAGVVGAGECDRLGGAVVGGTNQLPNHFFAEPTEPRPDVAGRDDELDWLISPDEISDGFFMIRCDSSSKMLPGAKQDGRFRYTRQSQIDRRQSGIAR